MVDEVTEKSFRIRHFGKGEDGNYSGELDISQSSCWY